MKHYRGTLHCASVVLFLGALLGTETATAQTSPTPEELHAAAERLFPTPSRHAKAAGLLCREADLRSGDDPNGVQALLLCGKLYYYAGELAQSRYALEDAARRALAIGDVVRAAHAFMDASFIAGRQGKSQAVGELAGKARMLAGSPLLTPGQRLAIEERVAGTIPVVHAGS
ncbi:MAG TPA: hypothetical protein VEY33_09990 [Gemmatimonadota bacterium]|nr:hypothetical protein [Gemmatimonadota bacterium]